MSIAFQPVLWHKKRFPFVSQALGVGARIVLPNPR